MAFCASAEKVPVKDARRRDTESRRHKGRRRERRGEEAGEGGKGHQPLGEAGGPLDSTADDAYDDDGSERSHTSYASECSGYSRQSAARCRRGGDELAREMVRGGGGGSGKVQVMNLADLRGKGLPAELNSVGRKPSSERGGGGGGRQPSSRGRQAEAEEEPPLSARSGRSEGARSAASARSDAQSDGVRSVASVSIRKYMGFLSEKRSASEVKKMVKDFVRLMVKGREMGVLCADGSMKQVLCGLTRTLDTFQIKSGDQTRKVRLGEVLRIVRGSEDLADLETPLDDNCSTLELDTSECISFRFAEQKAAELFTLCMQLFCDSQKQQ